MREKKHYNRGKEIAVTFPISAAEKKQNELNEKLEKELAVTEKQNQEQEELLKQLKSKLKKDK